MAPFKDEHVLLIAPGSQVTLAQLGLPESFTPARFRFPTRMFPAEKKGEYEPHKICEMRKEVNVGNNGNRTPQEDVEMNDVGPAAQEDTTTATEAGMENEHPENTQVLEKTEDAGTEEANGEGEVKQDTVEEIFYEEDVTSEEGAVYPIQRGQVVNWPCFFALLMHIRNSLSPPLHTPVIIISQPVWSARDQEAITQFVFEKFKAPGLCLMDSALATCYGYGVATATVVDVGKEKVDVTAVTDFIVNEHGRGIALEGCGGDTLTDRLEELLSSKGFTRDMCEQLKRSNITEILPSGTHLPGGATAALQNPNPATSMSTGASGGGAPDTDVPRGPGDNTQTGGEGENADDEGVLDVAAIVSGDTNEFLAQKEKEKAEKAAAFKKGAEQAQKQARLPNSKKETASFGYETFVPIKPENEWADAPKRFVRQVRDIDVGIERFLVATPKEHVGDRLSGNFLGNIADQIHHTILAVPDASKRNELWDSLIVVGNGSKIKGFTHALLSAITQKYILSPSATIFTSEIPSNITTPVPTGGATTPASTGQPGPVLHPAAHGVNPLLVAATHANNPLNAGAGSSTLIPPSHHRPAVTTQTPTSVKALKPPEYFPEWKEHGSSNAPRASGGGGGGNPPSGLPSSQSASGPLSGSHHGMEEAYFLGAQVAAKIVFIVDQGLSKGYLSRVEYNDNGPSAIHDYVM